MMNVSMLQRQQEMNRKNLKGLHMMEENAKINIKAFKEQTGQKIPVEWYKEVAAVKNSIKIFVILQKAIKAELNAITEAARQHRKIVSLVERVKAECKDSAGEI